jgi:hypothetical protein
MEFEMTQLPASRRNPLLPWWIGLVIIVAAVGYVAYRFSCTECGQFGGLLEFLVLGVVPVVYLVLMYLTFRSQSDSEKRG